MKISLLKELMKSVMNPLVKFTQSGKGFLSGQGQRGIGMMDAVIGMGVMTTLVTGSMSVMNNQGRNAVANRMAMQLEVTSSEIMGLLSNPTYCTNSLFGFSARTGAPTTLKRGALDKFPTGVFLLEGLPLKIESYLISPVGHNDADLPNGILPLPPYFGSTYLNVTFDKGDNAIGGRRITRSIKVSITADANGVIQSCRSSAAEAAGLWTVHEGTAKISYVDGDVSIESRSFTAADFEVTNNLTANTMTVNGTLTAGDIVINGPATAGAVTGTNVNATGTVSGSTISSTSGICIGTGGAQRCLPTSAFSCPNGGLVKSISYGPTGATYVCGTIACGAGQYLQGVNPVTGLKVCRSIPTSDCPAGHYAKRIPSDGSSIECEALPSQTPGANTTCPGNTRVTAVNGASVTCSNPILGGDCGTQYVNGIKVTGSPKCVSI